MYLNNTTQVPQKQPSFGAGLNVLTRSKPGEIIFDGIRQALMPKNDELISKIQKYALKDDIFIKEIADNKHITIELQKANEGNHYTSPIVEIIDSQECKTVQELG